MTIDFECEKTWWDAKASREENDTGAEPINRALRWREIERRLDGVRTILDGGGGTGRFSIPLAKRGYAVTHLDLSPAMLDLARTKAEGLSNIAFVEGNAADLSRYADRSFDLVLATDGAVSFCGPEAQNALGECARVTGGTLIATVFHRAKLIAQWVDCSVQATGRLLPAVYAMADRGEWRQDQFAENGLLTTKNTHGRMAPIKAFLPDELRTVLEQAGLEVVRVGGLGSLTHLCEKETIERVLRDEALLAEFIELCDRYDHEVLPDGPGVRERCGLIAVAKRPARV